MSMEITNTPSGASNDLYSKNQDVNKQELAVTDMSQKEPEKDLTGNVPGDNTVAEEYIIINNTTAIRDFGSIRIGATLIGQPVKVGPEATSTIKLSVEEVKKQLSARGAITAEAYIEAKKDRENNKKQKEEKQQDEKDEIDGK